MAVNPIYGPIYEKSTSDPNGTPGQTSGRVPATYSRQRDAALPTAGSTGTIAPFLTNPHLDPLAETFVPPAGPQQ